jgi:undecaprenyl diphosphate synthase
MSRRGMEPTLLESLREKVRSRTLPRHVAIIMDGNGRWAETRGLPRIAGHREGTEAVRAVTREARKVGVEALTLYAFSTQNWARPPEEVAALMQLLADFLDSERAEIMENAIRLRAIGELERLPAFVHDRLDGLARDSASNSGMTLTLALSYDAREEIAQAARRAAEEARGAAFGADEIAARLWTTGLPDLDLLVRTSGERRVSNFLLWQCAYAELAFSDILWPDFRELELLQALAEFQTRERRFGLTGAQAAARARPA